MSGSYGAPVHEASAQQSARNADDGGNADCTTERRSNGDDQHDDDMTDAESNNEEKVYLSHDMRHAGPRFVASGYNGPFTWINNSGSAAIHPGATSGPTQYTGFMLPQNNTTGLTVPPHRGASSPNHTRNAISQSSESLPHGSVQNRPESSAVYQPASSSVHPSASTLPQLFCADADGVAQEQSSATRSSPVESLDIDMEDEDDKGERDEQSGEDDGEEQESEDGEDESDDMDGTSDCSTLSTLSALSVSEPPPNCLVTSLTQLDIILHVTTERLNSFIRILHNILRKRTESSLYDLADELWSEADHPYQEEGSVGYFETEGDAAEDIGAKVGMWIDDAVKGYVSATQLVDELTRAQRSAQDLRPAMGDDSDMSSAQLVAVYEEINTINTSLWLWLRKLDNARNDMRRLIRTMYDHKEFRHVVPKTPDTQLQISVVIAEAETYEPFKLERFLHGCQRLGKEDLARGEICLLCCEEVSPKGHKEKSKFEVGRNQGDEEVEKEEEPTDVVVLKGFLNRTGRVADVACLRSWLQTSSKCPLTKDKLY